MTVKYTNNAETILISAVNTTDTIIDVVSVSGFPTLSVGDTVYLTISNPANTLHEVVLCTAITGTSLTVTRGYDNTMALDWPVGSRVSSRLTAGLLQYLLENQASVTESQISDFGTYLTSETNTTISLVNNILTYTDENGVDTNIDLGPYLDDTNLVTSVDGQIGAVNLSTSYQPLEDQRVSTTDSVVFNSVQLSGGIGTQGIMTWGVDDETVNLDVGNGVSYQLGQELGQNVRNISGATIANGTVVQISGASGDKPTITPADYSNELTSSSTFAIATETISNNSTGKVTSHGIVRGLDTSAFTEGVAIWLGANGVFTATKPDAPNHLVHVGWVVRVHATEGMILVKISNGWELEELHDVLITTPVGGEALVYNGTTGLWENQDAYVKNIGDTINGTLAVTGNITVTGTVDGRDVSTDGAKLDGIETGATADQTAAEILTAIKTVDGSSSGLDADLLDGQHGAYYTVYTDTAIANLVNTAPATLDTLNELAAALGDDPNFATTVTNNITTKVSKSGDTITGNITFGDNNKAIFGAGSDLQIYHNGINSIVGDFGTGNLSLQTNGASVTLWDASGAKFLAEFITSGANKFYHNGSQKLATTPTGVDVTGTVTADGLTITDAISSVVSLMEDGASGADVKYVGASNTFFISTGTSGSGNQTPRLSIGRDTGDISFYEDTGTTPKFFWDASAEFLGVGTTTPTINGESLRLVNGLFINTAGSSTVPSIAIADSNSGLFAPSAGQVAISTQGNERMRIDSSGNVGIGTSSPRTKLDIEGNFALDGDSGSTSSTTQTTIATYAAATFKGCKAVITANDGTDTYVTELLIANTASAATATEYGQVGTGTFAVTYDVDVSGGNVRILATAPNSTSTTYKVSKNLM